MRLRARPGTRTRRDGPPVPRVVSLVTRPAPLGADGGRDISTSGHEGLEAPEDGDREVPRRDARAPARETDETDELEDVDEAERLAYAAELAAKLEAAGAST